MSSASSRPIAAFVERGQGTPGAGRRQFVALRRDGSPVPVELRVGATCEGGVLALHGFIADLTEARRAEQATGSLERR